MMFQYNRNLPTEHFIYAGRELSNFFKGNCLIFRLLFCNLVRFNSRTTIKKKVDKSVYKNLQHLTFSTYTLLY